MIDEVEKIREEREKLFAQEMILLEKGLQSDNPSEFLKAQKLLSDIENKTEVSGKAYLIDPNQYINAFGFKDKPVNITYNLLRKMAKVPIIYSAISTRIDRVAEFAVPQDNKFAAGFVIRQKKKLFSNDTNEKPSKDLEKRITEMTNFIVNCGNNENQWTGDTFETFLRKVTKDSLELDQMVWENIRNKKGELCSFVAVDGATVRLAESLNDTDYNNYRNKRLEPINGYFPAYVQLKDGHAYTDFYPWELCFGIRNQSTDINMYGYGVSELEILIEVITRILHADSYNGNLFLNGSFPKGLLKVPNGINPQKLAEFRQQWNATMQGVMNAHKTPIIEAEKMDWVDLQKSNSDMEFSQWQQYLIKIVCAVFKMSPEDIGFASGSNSGSSLFEGNNETKLNHSRDKGLKPFLRFLQAHINKYIVNVRDPELEFAFVGIDADNEKDELEMDLKKAGVFMTLQEIRSKYNMPKNIADDDLLLNNIWMQAKQLEAQKTQNPDQNDTQDEEYQGEDGDVNKAFEDNFNNFYNSIVK